MRIWTGNSPMGWMIGGSTTVAASCVGGKMRIEVLSLPGWRARWILSGRVKVITSEQEVTARAEREYSIVPRVPLLVAG